MDNGQFSLTFIYIFGFAAFILGLAVERWLNKKEGESDGHPHNLDDLLEDEEMSKEILEQIQPPETPKPIVDIKLGAVKRPTAEQLWRKEHPTEAAEQDEMRKALIEIVPGGPKPE